MTEHRLIPTQLIFTYVLEFLRRLNFGSSTALCILISLATFKWLKRGVIYKFCLFDNSKHIIHSVIQRFCGVTPVEEVIIVDNSTTKIRLAEQRNVVSLIVVLLRADETIAETRLANTNAACAREADDRHTKRTVVTFSHCSYGLMIDVKRV